MTSQAATVYSQNFDVDATTSWTFNSSIAGDLAGDGAKAEANFFYDYSTLGIPAAPGGTSTRGMRLEANLAGTGVFSGMSASPTGLVLPAQYTLKAQVWQNSVGPFPGGGSGSTQLTNVTVGASGTDASFAGGTLTGVQSSASGEGGTNPDYRVYSAAFPDAAGSVISPTAHPGVYRAGDVSQNNTLPYYVAAFPGKTPPVGETTLFPTLQTGTTQAGTLAFSWHEWTIVKTSEKVNWYVDGVLLSSLPASLFPTTFGDNVSFGHADINAGSTTDTNRLIFGLFDNVTVTDVVPEPTSLSTLALGSLLLRRRR